MIEEEPSEAPADDQDPYEVGYKRPPKAHQFKKGQSGNPRGRKKGAKTFVTMLRAQVGQKIKISVGGKVRTVPLAEAFLMNLCRRALEGDRVATAQLLSLMQRYSPTGDEELEAYDLSRLSDDEFDELERLFTKAYTRNASR